MISGMNILTALIFWTAFSFSSNGFAKRLDFTLTKDTCKARRSTFTGFTGIVGWNRISVVIDYFVYDAH